MAYVRAAKTGSLIGKRIKSPDDVAAISQIYRDQGFKKLPLTNRALARMRRNMSEFTRSKPAYPDPKSFVTEEEMRELRISQVERDTKQWEMWMRLERKLGKNLLPPGTPLPQPSPHRLPPL